MPTRRPRMLAAEGVSEVEVVAEAAATVVAVAATANLVLP